MPDGILVKIPVQSRDDTDLFQYVPSRSSLFQYLPDVIHWPETKPNCLRAQRVKLAGTRRKIRRGSPRSRSPPLGERKKLAFRCWEPDIYCRLFRICPFLSTCPRPSCRVSSFPTLFYRTFAAMTTVIKSIEKMKPRGGDNWVRTLDYDYLERNYNIHKYYPQFIHNTDISTPELRAELSDKPIYAQASKLAKAKGATEKAPHNRKGQNKKQNDKHTQNQSNKQNNKQNSQPNKQIQHQNKPVQTEHPNPEPEPHTCPSAHPVQRKVHRTRGGRVPGRAAPVAPKQRAARGKVSSHKLLRPLEAHDAPAQQSDGAHTLLRPDPGDHDLCPPYHHRGAPHERSYKYVSHLLTGQPLLKMMIRC